MELYASREFGRNFDGLNLTEKIVVSKATQGLDSSALICPFLGTERVIKTSGRSSDTVNNLMRWSRPVAKVMLVIAVGVTLYTVVREEEWKYYTLVESVSWVFAVGAGEVGAVVGRLLGPGVGELGEIAGGIGGERVGY